MAGANIWWVVSNRHDDFGILVTVIDVFFPHHQREAVIESLKNMLLVMSTQGILRPPSTDSSNSAMEGDLWQITWTLLEPYLPTLKDELFPALPVEEPKQGSPVFEQQVEGADTVTVTVESDAK